MPGRMAAITLALAAVTCPVAAQETSTNAADALYRLEERLSAANSLGFDGKLEESRRDLLAVATEADAIAAVQEADSKPFGLASAIAGSALFLTAQNHDPEWGDEAGQAMEIEWLTAALARLQTAHAVLGQDFTGDYEYRGAAGQLWQHGHRLGDSRWPEWSAARVEANRLRLATQPDSKFETNMLAEALYDHGWLTGDKALLAEADTMLASLSEEDVDYGVARKQRAVARGEAPYDPPGKQGSR